MIEHVTRGTLTALASNVTDILTQNGYGVVRAVSESARFASFIVEKDGCEFFAKVARGDHGREIENEVWYALTLNRARETTASLSVRAPRIEAHGAGWYVCESLAGSPLVAREDARSASSIAGDIPALASLLTQLDEAFPETPTDSPRAEETDSAPVTDLTRRVDRWVARPLSEGTITPERVAEVKALINESRELLRPRLQHGDFVPWHIFQLGTGSYALVDGEHASLLKPRYYDLAYLASRLWTRLHAAAEARALVRAFLAMSDGDRHGVVAAFLPVLTQRAIGMHIDALNDRPENDYVEEAQDLLSFCLARDAGTLLGEGVT